MTAVQVGPVEVDRCGSCGGMWFDAFEDEAIKRAGAVKQVDTAPSAAADSGKKAACPRCNTPMVRMVDREQPHIWYESCSVCHGKFFDAGEFRDVAEKNLLDLFRRWKAKERRLS